MYASADINGTSDDLLRLCWSHQECWNCLSLPRCSWCPTTSSCVPNTSRISIFAPVYNADICPLWSERWELRSRPLGCHVSTITLLTSAVSVLSTFLVIGVVAIAIKMARQIHVAWKARSDGWWKVWKFYHPGWWRGWRLRLVDITEPRSLEERPLLGRA